MILQPAVLAKPHDFFDGEDDFIDPYLKPGALPITHPLSKYFNLQPSYCKQDPACNPNSVKEFSLVSYNANGLGFSGLGKSKVKIKRGHWSVVKLVNQHACTLVQEVHAPSYLGAKGGSRTPETPYADSDPALLSIITH